MPLRLALYISLASLALRIERVEGKVEVMLGRFAGVDGATCEFWHGIVHGFALSTVLRLETAATSRLVLPISRFVLDYGGECCSPPWMVEIVCDAGLRGGPARRLVQRRISERRSAGRSKPCR